VRANIGSMFGTTSDLDRGLSKTCSSTTRLAERAQLTGLKVCEVADQGKLPRGSWRQFSAVNVLVQTDQLYRSV